MVDDIVKGIVRELIGSGVYLYVEGDQLKYRVKKGGLTPRHRQLVLDNKAQIIDYLRQVNETKAAQATQARPAIEPRGKVNKIPLSFSQQRLWFIDQLEQGSLQYNMQGSFYLAGLFDESAFKRAFSDLLTRHEVLRTHFRLVDAEAEQVISNVFNLPFQRLDLIGQEQQHQRESLNAFVNAQVNQPFDLSHDVMLRIGVVNLEEQVHYVSYTMHHIVGDAWSIGIFQQELNTLYQAHCNNIPAQLAPLEIQYADYAIWQRNWLCGEVLERELEYWKKQLHGVPLKHNLPLDKPRPALQTFAGEMLRCPLEQKLSAKIRHACQTQGVSLFMFMETAFALLLGRYSNENDILLGSALAGRSDKAVENLIGFFLNTLVLRSDLSGNPSFLQLLQKNRKMILEAHEHQYVPFEKLVEELSPTRHMSHNALVQILFGVQNNEQDMAAVQSLEVEGKALETLEWTDAKVTTRFDMKLDVYESPQQLELAWFFNTALFTAESVTAMAANMVRLLESIVADLDAPTGQSIWQLDMVDGLQKQRLLQQWNTNPLSFPADQFIHQLIERHSVESADETAVIEEDGELNFGQLNAQANRLARLLRNEGIGPDKFVAVCFERSCDMIVALLAVLKAGGAYVPLDPSYPENRIDYILNDSQCQIILTSTALVRLFDHLPQEQSSLTIHCIDAPQSRAVVNAFPDGDLSIAEVALHLDNLAYAIYTSGSTGNPKGVVVSHRNVCDFLLHSVAEFMLPHIDGAVVSSPLVFDATVGSLWVALAAGKYIELLPEGNFALDRLGDCLADDDESLLFKITPSHLDAVLAKGYIEKNANARHVLVVAGEPMLADKIRYWMDNLLPSSLFINEYGPTEATVGTTINPLVNDWDKGTYSVPIGRILGDSQVYVLNEQLQLQGVGGIGQLYIGGAGVARGYLNRADLTAIHFVPDPFATEPGRRLYRTGDLVRYLPSGVLEFVGRVDYQIKLRGFRIELGEIESLLLQIDQVEAVVVMAQPSDDGDKRLVGYLVTKDSPSMNETELAELQTRLTGECKAYLGQRLPQFMVPQMFVVMNRFPLTINDKVDRKSLPLPGEEHLDKQSYQAPQNEVQTKMCELWQSLLKVERVGINDNFFALGGHSLLSMRLISMARLNFGVELSLQVLFESPTVATLCARLEEFADQGTMRPIVKADRGSPLPLSFAQQRLWFLDRLGQGSPQYNMPGHFMLSGPLLIDSFKAALNTLIERHEILRTCYGEIDGQPMQLIATDFELPLTISDITDLSDEQKGQQVAQYMSEQAQQLFDLSQDLMIRVQLLSVAADAHMVLYTVHHIASDGWSMAILQNELLALYQAYVDKKTNPLPLLQIQYGDFALWQHQWLQGEVLQRQLLYWQKQLDQLPSLHNLPLDKPRPVKQTFVGKAYMQWVDAEQTRLIEQHCQQCGVTVFIYLQTVFALLLGRFSGDSDVVVATPVAGRIHTQVEPLIGFFVNTLVLRTNLNAQLSFAELLAANKATILDAYEHQHLPFEQLVEVLQVPRDLSHNPLAQISFTLQNNEQGAYDAQLRQSEAFGQSQQHQLVDGVSIKLDLDVQARQVRGGLNIVWAFNQDLFEAQTIIHMADSFAVLLEAVERSLQQENSANIFALPLLDEQQLSQMYSQSQQNFVSYAQPPFVHQLIERQAALRPEHPALVFGKQTMSYEQLNRQANQLAHCLIAQGVGIETRVGICIKRSFTMVVSVLAVLKAGGCYVPLDPDLPQQRIQQLLNDSDTGYMLVSSRIARKLDLNRDREAKIQYLDPEDVHLERYCGGNPVVSLSGDNLCYVIYTSGSTGTPKGVAISHASWFNLTSTQIQLFGIDGASRGLQFFSLGFDVAGSELSMLLSSGGTLYLISSDDSKSPQQLTKLINRHQLSHVHFPAAILAHLDSSAIDADTTLIVGGDAMTAQMAQLFSSQHKLFNAYGPSETTVCVCTEQYQQGLPTIGRAMANNRCYVLDSYGQCVPTGVAGELYVGGIQLARGYLDNGAMTAQRFVPDPFSLKPGQRMYCTGDIVRTRSDGRLEFIGRVDHQVKIRGFRIELGEIENLLQSLPEVKEAALSVLDSGNDKRLVAYVVAANEVNEVSEKLLLSGQLKTAIGERLPHYMVPQSMVFLPQLPLTDNGKLDRKALPLPNESELGLTNYVAPTNEVEEQLCEIWQQLLQLEKVGIENDFFALGGHSLMATRLVNEIRQQFSVEIPLSVVFENSTVQSLALVIMKAIFESQTAEYDSDQFVDDDEFEEVDL